MKENSSPVLTAEQGPAILEIPVSESCRATVDQTGTESPGIGFMDIKWESEKPLPDLSMILWVPLREYNAVWNPSLRFNKGFDVDWVKGFRSEAVSWAPVVSLYRYDGRNALTLAVDDARRTLRIDSGVNEETARFKCVIHIPADGTGRTSLSLRLRLDDRTLPYHRCLQDVSLWWEELYPPLKTPEAAKQPLLSTWYSFHLGLDEQSILEECVRGKEMGFEGIIIDDGWQTDDTGRTYAFCGDWRPAPSKIRDMRAMVDRIHDMDMTCMLWYALPYIGEKAQDYSLWMDKVLEIDPPYPAWHVLDPRYPDVREHIISTYETALKEWNLDGFKLDFMDRFARAGIRRNPFRPGMDLSSIPEAVDLLLTELAGRLTALKPELLLECRQTYIGPLSRRYGNVFRAEDCPNSSLTNRVSLLDIRLLCGGTATHADPLMWNTGESPESAAMQFTHTLFSVPQVSVRLDSLTPEHKEMVQFWVGFYKAHRQTLLEGSIEPNCPEGLYDQVVLRSEKEDLVICYNNTVAALTTGKPMTIVNGAWNKEMILKIPAGAGERDFNLTDCRGREVETGKIPEGITVLPVPPASVLEIG